MKYVGFWFSLNSSKDYKSFHIQNFLTNGKLFSIPKTVIRVNDFWITYNQQNSVSQFYSDVSFLGDNGHETYRKTIYVNSPLTATNAYIFHH